MTYPLSFVTKKGSSFRYKSSHVLRMRVGIGDIFVKGSVFVFKDVVRTFCIFSFLSILDTLFLHCDSKPCTHFIYIYIYIYIERERERGCYYILSPITSCVVSFLSLCTCFLFIVCNLLFMFHTKMS